MQAIEIYRWLKEEFGDETFSIESVRHWVRQFKEGRTSCIHKPRSGRPRTALTPKNFLKTLNSILLEKESILKSIVTLYLVLETKYTIKDQEGK